MLKLLFTLAIVVFALMWWFGKGRLKAPPAPGPREPAQMPGAGQPAEMVACAHCGLHLPRNEALRGDGERWFCGAEHRRLGPEARR